jgi:hypothetical protein
LKGWERGLLGWFFLFAEILFCFEVWKCSKGGIEYAVKVLDEEDTTAEMEKYFADNVKYLVFVLIRLESPFLVKFFETFRFSFHSFT